MTSSIKHIAIFGDVHGHLRLMFQLCRLWQKRHGRKIDVILQCGDLGFFPELANVDHATRRYARRDPEELAFSQFFKLPVPPENDKLLERTLKGSPRDINTVDCPVIWCHGNHEDFKELEVITENKVLAPVDAFGRLKLLRSGYVTEIAGTRIAAVGGAPETEKYDDYNSPWSCVSEKACVNLLDQSFDILLTHGSPNGIEGLNNECGSELLRVVIEECQPAYHFYSHHKRCIPPAKIGRTKCHWINDVKFQRKKNQDDTFAYLEKGCMCLLTWNGLEDHSFGTLTGSWIDDITSSNWRYL